MIMANHDGYSTNEVKLGDILGDFPRTRLTSLCSSCECRLKVNNFILSPDM